MNKLLRICLLVFLFLLSACTSDNSDYTSEASQAVSQPELDLLKTEFVSEYYRSVGENGLEKLAADTPVACLRGKNGSLLYANTPTRMIFSYATDKYVWSLMEYDKLTGDFSYACHDGLCSHDSCLFSPQNKVFSGRSRLFFVSDFGDEGYYMSDLDGNNIKKLSIPNDAELYADTEKGLYWGKAELVEEKTLYSLWLYDYSSGDSTLLAAPAENASYYVIGDTVYMHDFSAFVLSRFSENYSETTEIAKNITYLQSFGGSLYDYNYDTGVLQKLDGDKMITVATIPSVADYWVSEGYVYYCCADQAYTDTYKNDPEIYEYLSEYNPTCGNIYRIKEFGDAPELVYHGSRDGKPDLIDHVFADGEVLYIQYRDYLNFPNNFVNGRGHSGLVIYDVTAEKAIDITNNKAA